MKSLFRDDVFRPRASVRATSDAAFSATQWQAVLLGCSHVHTYLECSMLVELALCAGKVTCLFAQPVQFVITLRIAFGYVAVIIGCELKKGECPRRRPIAVAA
jgi:hypothetical protein